MFVPGRRAASLLAALAVALTATGCSSSGSTKPVALPSLKSSSSASASPSPTSTAAELAAVEAVVRRYFELKANLARDMSTLPFEKIETQQCSCRRFLEDVRITAAKGEHYFGTTHIRLTRPSLDSEVRAAVLVEYDATSGGTTSSTGRVLFKGPARRGVVAEFTLRRVGGAWLIADIAYVSTGRAG